MTSIPIGKLPAELLRKLLKRYATADPRVVVGPAVGEDAAVIDMGQRYLVAKTDPITFATDEIGYYAVHVNANDLACCGATPRWYLATVLLPEAGTTPELADRIFGQISEACRQLGVSLCGGHTEITYGLKRPIVVGQMLGEVAPDGYVTSSGAQVGDTLILTKGFAVEGTAIIAREKAHELRGVFPDAKLAQCAAFLHDPGISVLRDARVAMEVGGVHAMHDPTEGGIAAGLWELAQAAGVGFVVDEQRLSLLPECRSLCRRFELDPLGLIASGALLIAAAENRSAAIIEGLEGEGIAAAAIGEVLPADEGCSLRATDGSLAPMPTFARDEITRLFE
ncbi:MAG: AIR synthase family protein [Planctomycetota bacterium]|jgi:hydrogenase maturation factor